MAKSASFFGIRSGSTKSHTYSAYRGQQVTKDRVTEVSNPQSNNQMSQRLVMPLVANAASQLNGIVNHSFEGTEYGWKSIQKFRSINLRKGALTVYSFVPKGAMDCGEAAFTISQGSLPSFSIDTAESDKEHVTLVKGNEYERAIARASGESDKDFVVDILKKVYSLNDGDQISLLTQHGVQNYTFNSDGDTVTGMRHGFVLSRIILDSSKMDDWTVTITGEANATLSVSMTDGYSIVTLTFEPVSTTTNAGFNGLSWNIKGDNTPAIKDEVCAAAAILSREVNNTWKRSTQTLASVGNSHAVTYEQAKPTYLKNASSDLKYLNTGNDSTSIVGNSYSGSKSFQG